MALSDEAQPGALPGYHAFAQPFTTLQILTGRADMRDLRVTVQCPPHAAVHVRLHNHVEQPHVGFTDAEKPLWMDGLNPLDLRHAVGLARRNLILADTVDYVTWLGEQGLADVSVANAPVPQPLPLSSRVSYDAAAQVSEVVAYGGERVYMLTSPRVVVSVDVFGDAEEVGKYAERLAQAFGAAMGVDGGRVGAVEIGKTREIEGEEATVE